MNTAEEALRDTRSMIADHILGTRASIKRREAELVQYEGRTDDYARLMRSRIDGEVFILKGQVRDLRTLARLSSTH